MITQDKLIIVSRTLNKMVIICDDRITNIEFEKQENDLHYYPELIEEADGKINHYKLLKKDAEKSLEIIRTF